MKPVSKLEREKLYKTAYDKLVLDIQKLLSQRGVIDQQLSLLIEAERRLGVLIGIRPPFPMQRSSRRHRGSK